MYSQYEIQAAKSCDPEKLWRHFGFNIVRESGEIRVMDGDHARYRSTFLPERGIWLSSEVDAGHAIARGVGDNISLFQYFSGKGFREAMNFLLDRDTACASVRPAPPVVSFRAARKVEGLRPLTRVSRQAYEYALARGIAHDTLVRAYHEGFVFFAGGSPRFARACCFQGFDESRRLRFCSKRLSETPKTGDRGEKYDMTGSNKQFVPFFGDPAQGVVMAEGGFSTLSAWELEGHEGGALMLGGIGNRAFLDEDSPARRFLARAPRIVFYADDDAANEHVRLRREELLTRLRECFPETLVESVSPPPGCGDANDWLRKAKEENESLRPGMGR